MNNDIGADYTSQTPIDFDWYNPHLYQCTTGIIKKFLTYLFSPTHKFMKACIYNSTFT